MTSDILANIGSGNGLVPDRHQAITQTSVDLLSVVPLGINLIEIFIEIQFFFKKMRLKLEMLSAK